MVMPFSSHLDETFQHTKPTSLSGNKILLDKSWSHFKSFLFYSLEHIANLKALFYKQFCSNSNLGWSLIPVVFSDWDG